MSLQAAPAFGAPLLDVARRVEQLSTGTWGDAKSVTIVGRDAALRAALERLVQFAASDEPVLLTGETGTGKELFARALYLLSTRRNRPFICVNCAQYHDGQLLASELFGHKRGSFTGAIADQRGVFEEAEGGVVLLDEIGELSVPAQAMLLRVLSEKEIMPVGSSRARPINVRVIAATSRDLGAMMEAGKFREDLYYRLRHFRLRVPAVRDRGDDWNLIAAHYLERFAATRPHRKQFTRAAYDMLQHYEWPGNVREVRSVVDLGYHLSDSGEIEPVHFAEALETASRIEQFQSVPLMRMPKDDPFSRMTSGNENFWNAVYQPYMRRELSRAEVKDIVALGLDRTRGSYKRMLALFNVEASDYLKFMDFLRHQQLKPE